MEDIDAHIPDVYEEVCHVQLAVTILCLSGLATVSAGNSFAITTVQQEILVNLVKLYKLTNQLNA